MLKHNFFVFFDKVSVNTVGCLGMVCPVSQHELLGRIIDVLF